MQFGHRLQSVEEKFSLINESEHYLIILKIRDT